MLAYNHYKYIHVQVQVYCTVHGDYFCCDWVHKDAAVMSSRLNRVTHNAETTTVYVINTCTLQVHMIRIVCGHQAMSENYSVHVHTVRIHYNRNKNTTCTCTCMYMQQCPTHLFVACFLNIKTQTWMTGNGSIIWQAIVLTVYMEFELTTVPSCGPCRRCWRGLGDHFG